MIVKKALRTPEVPEMFVQFIGARDFGGPRPQRGSIFGLPCSWDCNSDPGIQMRKTKAQETTTTQ